MRSVETAVVSLTAREQSVAVSSLGFLVVALIFGAPLLGIVVGLAMGGRVPNNAAVVALIAQAALLALLVLRYSTLPGDHYYIDRSVCRTASSAQSLQLYGLFWASIAAWAGSVFAAVGSGRLAGAKVGLVCCACVGGIVALLLIASHALCDPS